MEMCNQSACENLENMQQIKLGLQEEVLTLYDIGCPCDITSIFPTKVQYDQDTNITLTISGLNADAALGLGFVQCNFRVALEEFLVVNASYDGAAFVCLKSFTRDPGTPVQVTLTGTKWVGRPLFPTTLFTLSSSAVGSNSFTLYDASNLTLLGVTPPHSPSDGGVLLTVVGRGFTPSHPMACRIRTAVFPATVQDSTTATCATPPLAVGPATLSVSANAHDWAPELPFPVYAHPYVAAVASTGLPDAVVTILTTGELPAAGGNDTWCLFRLPFRNATTPAVATPAGPNATAFACPIPANIRHLTTPAGANGSGLEGVCAGGVLGLPCPDAPPPAPDCPGAVVGDRCFRSPPSPAGASPPRA
jgi:hypothetical protein